MAALGCSALLSFACSASNDTRKVDGVAGQSSLRSSGGSAAGGTSTGGATNSGNLGGAGNANGVGGAVVNTGTDSGYSQAGSAQGTSVPAVAGSTALGSLGGGGSAATGQSSSAGGSAVGGVSGQAGNASIGTLPEELVGVWQQTRASSGDYVSANGSTFSLTSGFNVQLKLSSNGAYYLANFGSGVAQTCSTVTNFEQSVGYATLVGDSLVFNPTEHALDVTDCDGQRHLDLGTAPFALSVSLEEAHYFYGGIRTYRMLANGGPHPYDLLLLHRPPLANPVPPPQPVDFTLGTDGPYQDFQGLWVAAAGTDSDFFNPSTGEYYFPALNGSPHAWMRMSADGYETAIALQNVNTDGPCKSDILYYEQGAARFAVLEDVGGQGSHFVGHALLESTAARMIVRIRECDTHDGDIVYDLPGLPRYFRFIYFSPASPPESIAFPCDFPLSEWQSILCEALPKSLTRRE